jgi:hypothetical protein
MSIQVKKTQVHPVIKKTTFKPIVSESSKVYKKNGVSQDIPPLTYGPNNNFITWNKGAKTHCAKTWVNLLSIWNNPPAVTELELPEPDLLRYNIDIPYTVAFTEQLKLVVKDQHNLIDEKRKLFHWFLLHLSNESEQKIKEAINWNEVNDAEDPLALYILIRDNHLGVQSGNRLIDSDRIVTQWQNIRQGVNESLSDYRDRFVNQIDALRGHNLTVPEEAMQYEVYSRPR